MSKNSKILFVHDHVFITSQTGEIYSSGCFPAYVWDRYLAVFDQVTVLARSKPSQEDSKSFTPTMKEGVNFNFCQSASNLKAVFGLNKVLNKHVALAVSEADAVIVRLSSELGMLALREAKRQKKPYAIELVDCPFDSYWNYESLTAKLYAPWMFARVRNAVRNAPFVLYVTELFLQARYPNKNGRTVACSNVNIPTPSNEALTRRLAKIDALEADSRLSIGQIASLTGHFKGIHTAIDALAGLKQRWPSTEYRILGAGASTEHQQKAKAAGVEKNVIFDGVRSSGEAVYSWLDELDIYVHPSLKEGLPRAVIEAMSRGCPVIASSVAGTPELLPKEHLIAPGDSAALAEKLTTLIGSKEELKAAAKRNFETSQRYSSYQLDERRTAFWSEFKIYAMRGNAV